MTSSKDGEGGESSGLTVVSSGHASGGANANDSLDKTTSNKLALLKQEHRELDEAILALTSDGVFDQLQLTRLKKRKLMLRDLISRIEDDNVPDIIA
jgi:hypothetical protein